MTTALVGDRVRFSFSFQRLGTTTPETPPEVTVTHRDPQGVETVLTLTGDPLEVIVDSVGNLHADFQVLLPKRHWFHARGSGDPLLEKSILVYIDVEETPIEQPIP